LGAAAETSGTEAERRKRQTPRTRAEVNAFGKRRSGFEKLIMFFLARGSIPV
jgi:hypothetical protein